MYSGRLCSSGGKKGMEAPRASGKCTRPAGRIHNRRGLSREATIRSMEMAKRKLDDRRGALSKWASWQGEASMDAQQNTTERLMGGMVADPSRHVYNGRFGKWAGNRIILGQRRLL